MPDWMPPWGTTALIAIVTSLLTLIVSGRYVSPLLEVRNRRFQAKMQARERFETDMLTIVSATTRLLAAPIPAGVTDSLRTALREERLRWQTQIDDATKHLIDHYAEVAFSYAQSTKIAEVAMRYSGSARMVWISDRPEDRKLNVLRDTTQQIHALLFDSPVYLVQRARAGVELERLLNEMESPPDP
ncbi:hypothetical protein [Streptomyces microflavus]|uniref:hypothetical protein n=1 Tax=Streptomyces microflavus TaxID=1919 RepID=UPI00365AED3C